MRFASSNVSQRFPLRRDCPTEYDHRETLGFMPSWDAQRHDNEEETEGGGGQSL